jgi:two-component system alkaline phosphatase synthesis response regulator PhoP
LLVDDEPDILEIVYNLNQEGYQIFTAANGKEAIAKAKRNCLI